jgi:hypothetical protein
MKKYITVTATGEKIKIRDLICIERGAYAVYPEDQGTANMGWVLLDDPNNYEFDDEDADDRLCESFIGDDGKCWEGDADFNLYIEHLYSVKHPK